MRDSYQTKQRRQILDFLMKHPNQTLSAKEIHAACRHNGTPVGLATVYRQLEQLALEGKAKKIVTGDSAGTRFQYVPESITPDVFYLKCDCCGELTQMDCTLLHQAADHMDAEHGFKINTLKSVLYGRCHSCKA